MKTVFSMIGGVLRLKNSATNSEASPDNRNIDIVVVSPDQPVAAAAAAATAAAEQRPAAAVRERKDEVVITTKGALKRLATRLSTTADENSVDKLIDEFADRENARSSMRGVRRLLLRRRTEAASITHLYVLICLLLVIVYGACVYLDSNFYGVKYEDAVFSN